MNVTIRPERPTDAATIHAVTRAAFRTAAHASGTEPHIVDALRAANALTVSLVADGHGQIVGHVAVSPVTIGDRGAIGWFGLGPISVIPDCQRQGVGTALMHGALAALRARKAAGCVLLGDPAFYRRFGFEPAAPLVLPDVPPEYFQALVFAGPRPSGVVHYHEGFSATG